MGLGVELLDNEIMDSRLVVVAVVVLVAVAVPTAAITVAESKDPVPVGDTAITLAPHDGPNGAYASVESGELEVTFEQLNADAQTNVDDVFTITATGDYAVLVWVIATADGVDAYRSGAPNAPFDTRPHGVQLDPGESISVGFEIDTNGATPESDTFTVKAEPLGSSPPSDPSDPTPTPDPGTGPGSSEFIVTNLSVPAELDVGDTAPIVATVENIGDADGTYIARLVIDGTVVDQQSVSIPAGESRNVTFERPFQQVGTYEVEIGSQSSVITVVSPDTPSPAFEMDDPQITDPEVEVGDRTTITITVTNTGTAHGNTTVELVIGGVVVDQQTVELSPGESDAVSFEWTFDHPGVFSVGIGGADAGEVTVLSGTTAEGRLLPSSVQTVVAAPLIILVLLLIGWRHWSE